MLLKTTCASEGAECKCRSSHLVLDPRQRSSFDPYWHPLLLLRLSSCLMVAFVDSCLSLACLLWAYQPAGESAAHWQHHTAEAVTPAC